MAVNAEKNAGLFEFTCLDMKKLDFFLYFSSPVFAKVPLSRLELLYEQALEYGSFLAKQYLFNCYEEEKTSQTLGVALIPYNEKELSVRRDKAYYIPFRKEIHWNPFFPSRLLNENDTHCILKDKDTVRAAVLTHEFFHHIEEHFELPADEYLRRIYKGRINPIFREIAAFAFTNKKIAPFYSQFIDLFQLKIENLYHYQSCITLCTLPLK